MKEQDAKDLKRLLTKRRAEVSAEIEHIDGLLRTLESAPTSTQLTTPRMNLHDIAVTNDEEVYGPFPVEKLRGMKQKQAMLCIAKHYGGVIRTQDLKRYLQAAGLMKKTKHASGMAQHLVVNSDLFDRISTGLYRLRSETPASEHIN
jgi:hypothetical protein